MSCIDGGIQVEFSDEILSNANQLLLHYEEGMQRDASDYVKSRYFRAMDWIRQNYMPTQSRVGNEDVRNEITPAREASVPEPNAKPLIGAAPLTTQVSRQPRRNWWLRR